MEGIRILSQDELRKMQLSQLGMIKEFDRVCRMNSITYCILAGTLLGAIRHKGYIPWDDDADIAMLREEYEKFTVVADQMDPSICFFQDHNSDQEYRWGYGKLRRTGTTYIRTGQEHIHCKTGFFVDIFPMDDIPLCVAGQVIQNFWCFCLRKVLWSEVGKKTDSNVIRRWIYGLLAHIPTRTVFFLYHRMEEKSRNTSKNSVRILAFAPFGALYRKNPLRTRYGMPKEWFLCVKEYEFEGVKLFGPADYDDFLKYMYGDYMTLPPVEQRAAHAPVSEFSFGNE